MTPENQPARSAPRPLDVLVVGAGPAGLTAAARLAAAGAGRVEVLERSVRPGGVPAYCGYGGFGTRTRPLTGPEYARLLTRAAERAGADLRTGVTALDWAPGGLALRTVGPRGPETVAARAVVLATGVRERPRPARLVPGTRPAGVYTTGELLQTVHLFGRSVGTRAVVVGAEEVAYTAADTLRASGTEVVALVTEATRACARSGTPLLTGTTVTELLGQGRLSGVRVRHRDGEGSVLPCDTVVFTGEFLPEDELARLGGITPAPGARTSRPGVFAAGGLTHPDGRAEEAARDGSRAADMVLEWLAEGAHRSE